VTCALQGNALRYAHHAIFKVIEFVRSFDRSGSERDLYCLELFAGVGRVAAAFAGMRASQIDHVCVHCNHDIRSECDAHALEPDREAHLQEVGYRLQCLMYALILNTTFCRELVFSRP
jgi:hypothetical protein